MIIAVVYLIHSIIAALPLKRTFWM